MNAREMFEELGYSLKVEHNDFIEYSKEDCGHIDFYFLIETKRFYSRYCFSPSFQSTAHSITLDEFEAVQKQMEELGWFEEEKQEIKQETNFEHYKDEILKDYAQNLAVVKGRPTLCYKTNCNDCDFKINQIGCREKAKDWLKQPHEKPVYKLTKFEKELLQCYPDIYSFKVFNSLNGMKEKGYFKGIDDNEIIGDILAKCEVIEDRKEVIKND